MDMKEHGMSHRRPTTLSRRGSGQKGRIAQSVYHFDGEQEEDDCEDFEMAMIKAPKEDLHLSRQKSLLVSKNDHRKYSEGNQVLTPIAPK